MRTLAGRTFAETRWTALPPKLPPRAQLAEAAARGEDILPALRAVQLAEALTAPPIARSIDLNAELAALCAALQQAACRRAGWLRFVPAAVPLPAAVPRALLQATILCFARRALLARAPAVLTAQWQRGSALLTLRAAAPLGGGDLALLLRRTAAITGGTAVLTAPGAPFAAALRLPLSPAAPRAPLTSEDYLTDRYSALYAALAGIGQ